MTNNINQIIEGLVKSSREEWKAIIESRENTPFIGIKQTIARALYEGKLEDTLRILQQLKAGADSSRRREGG